MDRTTRIGATLLVGLAAIALGVFILVLLLDVALWLGLVLLALLDAALLGWAWVQLKMRGPGA